MSASHLPFGFVGVHNRVVGNKSMGFLFYFMLRLNYKIVCFFPSPDDVTRLH